MDNSVKRLQLSFLPPFLFVAILWMIMLSKLTFAIDLELFGIFPRNIEGITGILTGPLVHSDYRHLISNSVPLIVMGTAIFYFYPKPALKVILLIYLATGLLVWIMARPAYHIGASGLVYGFAAFLFFNGVFRKDTKSTAIALLTVFIYGGMVWGILPFDYQISWESHLAGSFLGLISAFLFYDIDPPPAPSWEELEEDDKKYEHLNYKNIYRNDWQRSEDKLPD